MSNPLYTTIPAPKLKRNNFSLSHRNYLTMSQHENVPTLIKEILPGDIFRVHQETFCRVQPLIAPPMSSISMSHHMFYVPMRTLSKVWEDFITGGREGTNEKVLPYTTMYDLYHYIDYGYNDLGEAASKFIGCIRCFDYMGINFAPATDQSSQDQYLADWLSVNDSFSQADSPQAEEIVNLLPFVAIAKIYDEYYRDQNLEESVMDKIRELLPEDAYGYQQFDPDSQDWSILFKVFDRAWKKDRFTSALPFTQRGPEVYIPLAGTAPVNVSNSGPSSSLDNESVFYDNTGNKPKLNAADSHYPLDFTADLSEAELQTTINSFRQAERLQSWYERDARGGARLPENNLAHWGVPTLDATTDRAEFLGGEHFPIVISEVEQNSQTTEGSAQGTLAGKASGYSNSGLCKRFFREHGYIICLSSIMSQAIYSQGMDKMYFRKDRIDYAWPEFAHLGEEAILNKEVNVLSGNPEGVFGYTPRYSDYKSALPQVHGEFRSTLSYWLQQRKFDARVGLNKSFVMSKPDDGIFALSKDLPVDQFLVVINFGIRASRLLPFYGVPML